MQEAHEFGEGRREPPHRNHDPSPALAPPRHPHLPGLQQAPEADPAAPGASLSRPNAPLAGGELPETSWRQQPQPQQAPPPSRKPPLISEPGVPAFLLKLYTMVEDRGLDDVIGWSPSGSSFVVVDTERLASDVLPSFFRHNNFQSFVRQLNLYGFHKLRQTTGWHEFSHPSFRQGRKDLLPKIRRRTPNAAKRKGEDDDDDDEGQQAAVSISVERVAYLEGHNAMLSQENKLLWDEVLGLKSDQGKIVESLRSIVAIVTQLRQQQDPNGAPAGNGLVSPFAIHAPQPPALMHLPPATSQFQPVPLFRSSSELSANNPFPHDGSSFGLSDPPLAGRSSHTPQAALPARQVDGWPERRLDDIEARLLHPEFPPTPPS